MQYRSEPSPHTSVVTFAFGFVTLTPSCFARAMMSIRFRDETLCAILQVPAVSEAGDGDFGRHDVLRSICPVVHQEELDILGVADQKRLVTRGHHVSRLLVGAEADLRWGPRQKNIPKLSTGPGRQSSVERSSPRTDGITWLPRNRRRTRLSIPLGLRQLGATHLKRSLWCRMKRFVPAPSSR